MFMKTRLIKEYFEPFKDPTFLPHIKNLRIGTRALTFWPQRFTTDDDADALMTTLREVKEIGGRHIAIMAHLSHVRELQVPIRPLTPLPLLAGLAPANLRRHALTRPSSPLPFVRRTRCARRSTA